MKKGLASGFTLIELMIVVAIISILAAVAIPGMMDYLVKSKRTEAYQGLHALYDAQIAYKAEKDYFSLSLFPLGFSMGAAPSSANLLCVEGAMMACGKYYSVYVKMASVNAFGIVATGEPQPGAGNDEFVLIYP